MFDLVIRGGTVVDGTGATGIAADVAIEDGRVVAIEPGDALSTAEARATIDRRLFGEATTVKVRITASDGFRSVTTERSLKVADL